MTEHVHKPLTAADLDKSSCHDCGKADCLLIMASECHPGYPLTVSYRSGLAEFADKPVLLLDCGVCDHPVAAIEVATGQP